MSRGGFPLDERPEAALLRDGFAEPRPGGFAWRDLTNRFPALRPPPEVVADYARLLALMGLLLRDPAGLWRPGRAAVIARDRHRAAAVRRIGRTDPPTRSGGW